MTTDLSHTLFSVQILIRDLLRNILINTLRRTEVSHLKAWIAKWYMLISLSCHHSMNWSKDELWTRGFRGEVVQEGLGDRQFEWLCCKSFTLKVPRPDAIDHISHPDALALALRCLPGSSPLMTHRENSGITSLCPFARRIVRDVSLSGALWR